MPLLFLGTVLSGWADCTLSPNYLFNSDPTMHVIDGQLWLFTTHDQTSEMFIKGNDWGNMYDYHALSTKDFHTWVDHGSILSILDTPWAKGNALWDGDAGIAANGKYYAYTTSQFEIGVLVSDNPAGPYKDALGHPMITQNACSPAVFRDDDGTAYLIYGWGQVYLVKLKPNMIEMAGEPVHLSVPKDFVESPIMTKINGKYYFTYSNGGMWGEQKFPKPQIKYSVSDHLLGPFTDSKLLQDIQINPDGQGFVHKYAGNAHQDLRCYKGQWYFAYNRDSKDGIHRHVGVTKLEVHADGTLGVIDPNTDKGVVEGPINFVLDAFAPYKREAEEFHARQGADEELGGRQDYHFKMKNEGFLRYNHMDFGQGAGGYRIEVSCENPKLENGKVEFRLDAPNGTLIGESPVVCTGGKTNYVVLTGATERLVGGIHDLFIVAHGEQGDASGHLFNINWFTFTKNAPSITK